ncbi:MAG: hypothetical protein MN733_10915, partial [Nitrososphaera sp.]|nr:hypothetical protein [Nitrososphaera sp.]
MTAKNESRINEWFVPRFGPTKFRALVGLFFLPYTGMCISFTLVGALLAGNIIWDRVGSIALIYALALGVSAHAADTIGSKKVKPWGNYFSKSQLLAMMIGALAIAYAIGLYYIVLFVPLLAIIAALEGFFLFAYNFEIWGGRFHTDFWFAVSWGFLPTLAGYIMLTNAIDVLPLIVGCITGLVSYLEIKMSRPYKQLKRDGADQDRVRRLENGLKIVSLGTIAIALSFLTV